MLAFLDNVTFRSFASRQWNSVNCSSHKVLLSSIKQQQQFTWAKYQTIVHITVKQKTV